MERTISLFRAVNIAAAVVSGLAILALMLHVTADVVLRTTINSPVPGTLEIVANWWMVTIVFLGIGYTTIRNEHIAVDLLPDRLPERQRIIARIFVNIVTIAVLGLLIYFGWNTALASAGRGETAVGVTPIPIWPFRFLVPLGALLMVCACVSTILSAIAQLRSERTARS